jgi:hypothetical protein
MANLELNYETYIIEGDGVSLVATIYLPTVPVSAIFMSATNASSSNPVDVSANVSSTVLVGSIVTVNFVAAFTGPVIIALNVLGLTPLSINQGTSPWIVAGNLTNNNAVPAANNLGVLTAIATTLATEQTYTNGDQVLIAVDTKGNTNTDLMRVLGVAVVTAAAGVQMVGVEGHAGGILDAVTGAAVPANAVQMGASDGTNLQPLSINVKGTQGARGLAVQELKDSGRTYITFTLDAIAGVTTEALATMNINNGGTVTTATHYTVTAGKTFRVQSMSIAVSSSSGTNDNRARLRSGATVSATSGILCSLRAASASSNCGNANQDFPDGIEVAGGQQLGISTLASSANAQMTCSIAGYEY